MEILHTVYLLKAKTSFENVDLEDVETRNSLVTKTPTTTLPFLETPKGNISESRAIEYYLCKKYKPELLGNSVFEKAKVNQWVEFASCELNRVAKSIIYPIFGWKDFCKNSADKENGKLKEYLKLLENELKKNEYITGKNLTLADIAIFKNLRFFMMLHFPEGMRKSLFPTLTKWFEKIMNSPEAVKAYGRTVLCKNPIKAFQGQVKRNYNNVAPKKKEEKEEEEVKEEKEEEVKEVKEEVKQEEEKEEKEGKKGKKNKKDKKKGKKEEKQQENQEEKHEEKKDEKNENEEGAHKSKKDKKKQKQKEKNEKMGEKLKEESKNKEEEKPKKKLEYIASILEKPRFNLKEKENNPLDSLPASKFDLPKFKEDFMKNTNKKGAMRKFWKEFDKEGYSLWHLEYNNEPSECIVLFRTCIIKGDIIQQLKYFRKYAFGVFGVYGSGGDYKISGVLLWRGQEVPDEVKEINEYKKLTIRKLDPAEKKDQQLVHDYWTKIAENERVLKRKAIDTGFFY